MHHLHRNRNHHLNNHGPGTHNLRDSSCFYDVYNHRGYRFLESVYEKTLKIELERHGVAVVGQSKIDTYCGSDMVGEFLAYPIVEDRVIIEPKAAEAIHPQHEAQLLNYLKATRIEVGLL